MKINKIDKHSHDRYCLDPWVCYHNTIYNTKVNNGDKSLFNHLSKYRESKDIHYISNYKFRNNDISISKYEGKSFYHFTIFNTSIRGISIYFENMHNKDDYSYSTFLW